MNCKRLIYKTVDNPFGADKQTQWGCIYKRHEYILGMKLKQPLELLDGNTVCYQY